MTAAPATKSKKQAFDFARNSMWTIDPDDLCIVGGKALPKDEQGPLDTAEDEDHALYDRRLYEPLTQEFINNIYAVGVDTPILIAKLEDLATVVAGRSRVRAARVANKRRIANGEPPIKIDCKMKRDTDVGLMGTMITENEARRDDDLLSKIAKLKRFMNKGISLEDAAIRFNIAPATAKNWLAFDDNALSATKKAVEQGRISPSAGTTLARIKEPEKQKEALEALLEHAPAGGKASTRAARVAANNAGVSNKQGVTDKRSLKALLAAVQDTSHPNAGEKTLAWWEGAEDMLKLVLGEEAEPRLRALLVGVYAKAKKDREK